MITLTDWRDEAKRLKFDEGKSWTQVAEELRSMFPELDKQQVLEKVRGSLRCSERYKGAKSTDVNNTVLEMLRKGTTQKDIAQAIGASERVVCAVVEEIKQRGYNVLQSGEELKISSVIIPCENRVRKEWNGEKVIRFGLMGDTQINSKYTQITHLHTLYDFYASEGIETVYMTGDIDEGEEMRPGHKYECYNQGADDHVDEIVRVYPARKGITTEFITGNHDHSLIKRAGMDIGKPISDRRKDMKYLGQSSAVIYLTDNCTLELRHPIDGTAYAISYKTQKMIEALSGGEKPNIMAVGHYHKCEYIPYRNVQVFQTGCLQAQTPWMRGKGIAAMMGGWIIEAHVNDDGSVNRIKQEWMPFYRAIKDDYLNWRQ